MGVRVSSEVEAWSELWFGVQDQPRGRGSGSALGSGAQVWGSGLALGWGLRGSVFKGLGLRVWGWGSGFKGPGSGLRAGDSGSAPGQGLKVSSGVRA